VQLQSGWTQAACSQRSLASSAGHTIGVSVRARFERGMESMGFCRVRVSLITDTRFGILSSCALFEATSLSAIGLFSTCQRASSERHWSESALAGEAIGFRPNRQNEGSDILKYQPRAHFAPQCSPFRSHVRTRRERAGNLPRRSKYPGMGIAEHRSREPGWRESVVGVLRAKRLVCRYRARHGPHYARE